MQNIPSADIPSQEPSISKKSPTSSTSSSTSTHFAGQNNQPFFTRWINTLKAKHLIPQRSSAPAVLAGLTTLFLVVGVIAGSLLVKTSQDVRQQASGELYDQLTQGAGCSGVPEGSFGCDKNNNQLVCGGGSWRTTGQRCVVESQNQGPQTISCFEYEVSSGDCIQRGPKTEEVCKSSYAFGGTLEQCRNWMANPPVVNETQQNSVYGTQECNGGGGPGSCIDRDSSQNGVLIQICKRGLWSSPQGSECAELIQASQPAESTKPSIKEPPTATTQQATGSCLAYRGGFIANGDCDSRPTELQVCRNGVFHNPNPGECGDGSTAAAQVATAQQQTGANTNIGTGGAAQICQPSAATCLDSNTLMVCNSTGTELLNSKCSTGSRCQQGECRAVEATQDFTAPESQTVITNTDARAAICTRPNECIKGLTCLSFDIGGSPSGGACSTLVDNKPDRVFDYSTCNEQTIAACDELDNPALNIDWECVLPTTGDRVSCRKVPASATPIKPTQQVGANSPLSEQQTNDEEPTEGAAGEQQSSNLPDVLASAANQACGFLGSIGLNFCGGQQEEESTDTTDAIQLATTGASCGATPHGGKACITRSGTNGGSYYICDNGNWHENAATYYCGAGNSCVNGSCGCESGNCQSQETSAQTPAQELTSESDCSAYHFGFYSCPEVCNRNIAFFSTCQQTTETSLEGQSQSSNNFGELTFSGENGYNTSEGSLYSQLDYSGVTICGGVSLAEAGCGVFVTARLLNITPQQAAEFYCAGGSSQYVAKVGNSVGETAIITNNGTSLAAIQGVLSSQGIGVGEEQRNITYLNGVDYAVDEVDEYTSFPGGEVVATIDHVVCTSTSCRVIGHQIIITGVSYDSSGNPIINAQDSIYTGGWRVCSQSQFDVNSLGPEDEGCAIIKHILPIRNN